MNELSPLNRRLFLGAICLLDLSGVGFLYAAVTGDSHGLKAWLLPFGPWSCAFLLYSVLRKHRKNENVQG